MAYIQQKLSVLTGAIFIACFGFVVGADAKSITEENVIHLVNESRLSHGAHLLKTDSKLSEAARLKARHMLSEQYFAHTSPDGVTPWVWIDEVEYDYSHAGENLAIHFTDTASQHAAWMKSPTHRKNILSPEYTGIGVAVERGSLEGKETTVVVQFFGREVGESVPADFSQKAFETPLAARTQVFGLHMAMRGEELSGWMQHTYVVTSAILIGVFILSWISLGYAILQMLRVMRKKGMYFQEDTYCIDKRKTLTVPFS